MSTQYLAIDKDEEFHNRESAAWTAKGVTSIRVDSMDEGIKHAKKEEFKFIAINSDNITEYMFKLRFLRYLTNSPILVATSNYSIKEHIAALKNGADAYGLIGTPEENVDLVDVIIEKAASQQEIDVSSMETIVYNNMLIVPKDLKLVTDDCEIKLTKADISILCVLIRGNGKIFNSEHLFSCAYPNERNMDPHDSIKSAIYRLRKKLIGYISIKNAYGKGYRIEKTA